MLAYEDLFLQVYVLIDDLLRERRVVIPARPGPQPKCSDSEVLTISSIRHLLGRRSESGFLEEVRANWLGLFPHLPVQSELNRRVRWLWGASELIRQELIAAVPADSWSQVGWSLRSIRRYERSASQASQPTSRLRRPPAESSAESVLSARLSAMVWS